MSGCVLTPSAHGPMLLPPFDVYLTTSIVRYGRYSPAEFDDWAPYLRPGAVVVDAGANCGAHTLAFARAVGPTGGVLAFEPQWMPYAMLCGTLALNGCDWVRAHRMGLGRSDGVTTVATHDFTQQNNFGNTVLGTRHGEPVEVRTLDSFAIGECAFLKVDVEGMELEVLAGAVETIRRCQPVIAAECENAVAKARALREWLEAEGYTVRRHVPPLGEGFPGVGSHNVLAVPRGMAVPEGPHIGPMEA